MEIQRKTTTSFPILLLPCPPLFGAEHHRSKLAGDHRAAVAQQRNRASDNEEPNLMSTVIEGDQVGNEAENIPEGIMSETNDVTNTPLPDDEMHGTEIAPHPSIQHLETKLKFLFWISGLNIAALFGFAAARIVEGKFDTKKIFLLFCAISLLVDVMCNMIAVLIIHVCHPSYHFVAVFNVLFFTTLGAALSSVSFCFILVLK